MVEEVTGAFSATYTSKRDDAYASKIDSNGERGGDYEGGKYVSCFNDTGGLPDVVVDQIESEAQVDYVYRNLRYAAECQRRT